MTYYFIGITAEDIKEEPFFYSSRYGAEMSLKADLEEIDPDTDEDDKPTIFKCVVTQDA
jgi:hypothetical protein